MVQYTVKRSMSPDGKIDSVSVEVGFETEGPDDQAVLDVIASTDAYAKYVSGMDPQPRAAAPTSGGGQTTSEGGQSVVTGSIRAIFDGEPSKTSGKLGPAAIIIGDTKVKTFDKNLVEKAREAKNNGQEVEVTYIRNEKWKSNDAKSLKVA